MKITIGVPNSTPPFSADFELTPAQVVALRLALTPPVVTPPPTPPPVEPLPEVISRIVKRPHAIIMAARMPTLSKHTITTGFSDGNRYLREQDAVELAGQTVANPEGVGQFAVIRGFIETTAAPQLTFGAPWTAVVTLTPRVGDPIMLPPQAVAAEAWYFDVVADLATIPEVDGGYRVGVSGAPPGWGVLEYPMYVRHSEKITVPQTHMLVVSGSYTHDQPKLDGQLHFSYAWVPARFAPIVVPLPKRAYPPITSLPAVKPMSALAYTMPVPFKEDDIYRPSRLPSGAWTSANVQNYGFESFYERAEPSWTILQGPRGRGNLVCATSLHVTARTDTPAKFLFTQPHNVGSGDEDGTIHIEWGYYHDEPPPYTNWDPVRQQRPPAPRKFAGGWADSVPPSRRFVRELWDQATDPRTTPIDETSPLIGVPPQHSHMRDVVKYVTETAASRNTKDDIANGFGGRVLRLTYDKADLARTAIADEFINFPVGAKPWGCVVYNNLLLVTLAGWSLVNAYDLDSGALVWSVQTPMPVYGIRVMDGVAYLGLFQAGSGSVWKLHLGSLALVKFFDCAINGNSRFVNVAVSDGSFMPRGSVAYVTWSNNTYGWPAVHGPDGKRLPIGARNMSWGEPKGTFVPPGLSYAGACAIGQGQMLFATVQDGLHRVSAALPTDEVVPTSCMLGYQEMYDRDLHLAHSDYFFSPNGVRPPLGKYSANIDALIANMGLAG